MTTEINGVEVSLRTVGYLEAILWSETVSLPCVEDELVDGCMDVDEDNILHGIKECTPLNDHFDWEDFTAEAIQKAESELNDFFAWMESQCLTEVTACYADDDTIAYDFWLTRNGHGAGFWDGDYHPDKRCNVGLGLKLSDGAKAFGEQHVWIDESGKLHLED